MLAEKLRWKEASVFDDNKEHGLRYSSLDDKRLG